MYLYLITNLINNKKYVGITNDYKKRWSNHKCGNSPSMAIAKAIKKYGVDNFKFEVLLSNIPIEEIDEYEIKYIIKYNSHVSNGHGYNISRGGRYNIENTSHDGEANGNSKITDEEALYIKEHRCLPMYVLYDDFCEKIGYQAFRDIYNDKTFKHIKTNVQPYPHNRDFSSQFSTTGKLTYPEVVNLRKQYNQGVYWKNAYTEDYKVIYPNEMSF